MFNQFGEVDSQIIGFCLNLECQEQHSYFSEENLRDPQIHNQCKNYCKTVDEVQLILEFLIYELKQQQLSQGDQQFQQIEQIEIEIQNYQRMLSNLNQGQYIQICEDIKQLKIQYNILNKENNQNNMIQFCEFILQFLGLQQGIQLIQQQNWTQALQYFKKISEEQLKNDIALFYLSVILLELNQCSKSQKMYDKLKKEYPTFFQDSIQGTIQNLSINPIHLAQLLLLGHSLFQTKSFPEAIKISDRILQIDKNNINALMGKIASLVKLQQFQQAIQVQTDCLTTNLKKSVLMCCQGLFLVEQHQLNEAMICYDNAIQLDANNVDAYYNKGNLYLQQLKLEDAITCFDKVIELDPYNAEAYNNKGVVLRKLKKHEEAIICFDKAIQYDPNLEIAHTNKGSSLFISKNYLNAIICQNRALYLNPSWVEPYVCIGSSFYNLINRRVVRSLKLDLIGYHKFQNGNQLELSSSVFKLKSTKTQEFTMNLIESNFQILLFQFLSHFCTYLQQILQQKSNSDIKENMYWLDINQVESYLLQTIYLSLIYIKFSY